MNEINYVPLVGMEAAEPAEDLQTVDVARSTVCHLTSDEVLTGKKQKDNLHPDHVKKFLGYRFMCVETVGSGPV